VAADEQQMSLLNLWPCNVCNAHGRVPDREGEMKLCPTCRGAGTLDYDPEDKSEIPF